MVITILIVYFKGKEYNKYQFSIIKIIKEEYDYYYLI